MSERREVTIPDEEIRLGARATTPMLAAAVGGVAALAAAFLLADAGRFLAAYLTAFAFWLSLSLGALFFVILQHLTRAGWSVTVRRIAEVLASNVLPLAVLFVPVLLGLSSVYPWAHGGDHGGLHGDKAAWLNPTAFSVRAVACLAVWVLLARFFLAASVRQDASGDPGLTARMQRFAPLATVLYALTVTLAAFDLLMSLDPHWYSTIYGVYYFAGGVMGFFALLVATVFLLQRAGRLTRSVDTEHYHDLGKQLFGYLVFWAYIAFSQYMLIWYANIPEETRWYLARQEGAFGALGLALLAGHFAVPFLALLPRAAKRRPVALFAIALWLLLMHAADIVFLVGPAEGGAIRFALPEVLCLVGLGGLFAAAALWRMSRVALIPAKDPRLPEALSFENL